MEVSLLDFVMCLGHGCILVLIFTFKRQVAMHFKYSYPQSPPLCTHTVLARICPSTHLLGHNIAVGQFFPVVYYNIGEEWWDFTASGKGVRLLYRLKNVVEGALHLLTVDGNVQAVKIVMNGKCVHTKLH